MHMHGLRSNLLGARCRDKSGKKHKLGVSWAGAFSASAGSGIDEYAEQSAGSATDMVWP